MSETRKFNKFELNRLSRLLYFRFHHYAPKQRGEILEFHLEQAKQVEIPNREYVLDQFWTEAQKIFTSANQMLYPSILTAPGATRRENIGDVRVAFGKWLNIVKDPLSSEFTQYTQALIKAVDDDGGSQVIKLLTQFITWNANENLTREVKADDVILYINSVLIAFDYEMKIYAKDNQKYITSVKTIVHSWLNLLQRILNQIECDVLTLNEEEYEALSNDVKGVDLKLLNSVTDRLFGEYLVRVRRDVRTYVINVKPDILDIPEPRKLTIDEINYILQNIQHIEPRTCDHFSAQIAGQKIRANLLPIFETLIMTPHPLAISQFINETSIGFYRAKIEGGFPAGSAASDATGQPISQMSLDSFHDAGSGKSVGNLNKRVFDLLRASPSPTNTITTIMFNEPQTLHSIYEKKGAFVGVTLHHLEWTYDMIRREDFVAEWWHDVFCRVYNKTVQSMPSIVLRMYLDIDEMYMYRVEPNRVLSAIMSPTDITSCILQIIHSPISSPISHEKRQVWVLDLIFDENKVQTVMKNKEMDKNLDAIFIMSNFLVNVVIEKFNKIVIQGIPGINELSPEIYNTWSVIRQEVQISHDELYQYNRIFTDVNPDWPIWKLSMDVSFANYYNISSEDIGNLCKHAGMLYVGSYHDNVFVQIPHKIDFMPDGVKLTPTILISATKEWINVVNRAINNNSFSTLSKTDLSRLQLNIFDQRLSGKEKIFTLDELTYLRSKRNELDSSMYKYYAIAIVPSVSTKFGFIDVLKRDDVDGRRTYSGNIHENYQVLGLLATKRYLFGELYRIFRFIGSNIGPRHISLIVDAMFRLGYITGISYTGIKTDPISMASYQRPSESFSNSAMTGVWSKPGMSASVVMNSGTNIGTGYSKIISDPLYYRHLERHIVQSGQLDPETIAKYYESGDYSIRDSAFRLSLSGAAQLDLPDPGEFAAFINTKTYDSNSNIPGHAEIRPEEIQSMMMQTFLNEILRGVKQAKVDPNEYSTSFVPRARGKHLYKVMGINTIIRSDIKDAPKVIDMDILIDKSIIISTPSLPELPAYTPQQDEDEQTWDDMSEQEKLDMMMGYMVKIINIGDTVPI